MRQFTLPQQNKGCLLLNVGPTVGKSAALGALFKDGVFIFDTDDLLVHPKFFKAYLDGELWKQTGRKTPEREAVSRFKDIGTLTFLIGSKINFAITNLWGTPIQEYAHDFYSIQNPASVIASRLVDRGQFPTVAAATPLAKKWSSTWVKYRSVAFDGYIEGSRALHLSDYLGMDKSSFSNMEAVEKAERERLALSTFIIDCYLANNPRPVEVAKEVITSIYTNLGREIIMCGERTASDAHKCRDFPIPVDVPKYFRNRI